ncbi:hypothetical protein ABT299_11535 [Spirillospora sp. NPDC000708]
MVSQLKGGCLAGDLPRERRSRGFRPNLQKVVFLAAYTSLDVKTACVKPQAVISGACGQIREIVDRVSSASDPNAARWRLVTKFDDILKWSEICARIARRRNIDQVDVPHMSANRKNGVAKYCSENASTCRIGNTWIDGIIKLVAELTRPGAYVQGYFRPENPGTRNIVICHVSLALIV